MSSPFVFEDSNLSVTWLRVLNHIISNPGSEISPLIITVTDFEESQSLKNILNTDLLSHNLDRIDTVSETIFPDSLYQICGGNRELLYKRYIRNLPRIKKVDKRNKNGTYFERLIAFGESKKVNQLEIIISSLQKESKFKRRSKLQAAIFDPLTDHKEEMYQGFPCLQHVTFYKSESGNLVLNSFYATQWLYQRAYGNWLGLINLGRFIAKEAQIELERFNCFIGVEILDHLTKTQARELVKKINS